MDGRSARWTGFLLVVCLMALAGCGGSSDQRAKGNGEAAAKEAELPKGLFVEKAMDGAVDVAQAKAAAKEGDEIVMRGQIGGTKDPFVKGLATLTVCDMSLKGCNSMEGDGCKSPWDMCCESDRNAKSALIQISNAEGKPLNVSLEGKNGLLPLGVIVVKGKVGKRPDPAVLVVHAETIFVEKEGLARKAN